MGASDRAAAAGRITYAAQRSLSGVDARRVLADSKLREWHQRARRQLADIDSDDNQRRCDLAALIPGIVRRRRPLGRARHCTTESVRQNLATGRCRPDRLPRILARQICRRRDRHERHCDDTSRIPDWLRAAAMLNLAWTHVWRTTGRGPESVQRIVDNYEDEGRRRRPRGTDAPYRGPIKIHDGQTQTWSLADNSDGPW